MQEGQPVQQPVKPAPDMEADHARHGAGVSTRGGAHLHVQLINMKMLRCGQ